MTDTPADVRRTFRRIAEGNLGRLQIPALEARGVRINRNLKKLTGAIVSWALINGGSTLVNAPPDSGWHHYAGEAMVTAGIIESIFVCISLLRHDRGRGHGRR